MHPLITQALITDHVRDLHADATAAAQDRQVRHTRPGSRPWHALIRANLLTGPKGRRALRAV